MNSIDWVENLLETIQLLVSTIEDNPYCKRLFIAIVVIILSFLLFLPFYFIKLK